MSKTGKNNPWLLLLLVTLVLSTAPAWAQEDPGGDETIDQDPDATPVPIDGGLAVLLAAGAGYGLKKYHARRQAEKEINS